MAEDASVVLMENMYGRLYNLLTTEPTEKDKYPDSENAAGRFSNSNAAIHLSVPGIALFSEDYSNMWTLGNPGGLKSRTALFSLLVDAMPTLNTARYMQSGKRVSQAWKAILEAANATSDVGVDADTKSSFDDIEQFLYEMRTPPEPPAFMRKDPKYVPPKPSRHKTAVYENFEKLKDEIGDAQDDLRKVIYSAGQKAFWDRDLSEEEVAALSEDRKKHLRDRALRESEDYYSANSSEPTRRYKRLVAQFDGDPNNKYVEMALEFTKTHGNQLSMALIKNAKELAEQGDWSGQVLQVPIKLSLPSSTKWAEKDNHDGWSTITANTSKSDVVTDKHHSETHGSAGWGACLWGGGGGADKTHDDSHLDTHFQSMSVSMEVTFVNIIRPWMDLTLFSDHVKWNAGTDQEAGSISSGKLETQTPEHFLPLIPMQMVVARNVRLTADWNDEHKQFVKDSLTTHGSAGWGPFSVSVSHTETHEHFEDHKKGAGSTFLCPGLQLLGFVSQVPPHAATDDGNGKGDKLTLPFADEKAINGTLDQLRLPPEKRDPKWQD